MVDDCILVLGGGGMVGFQVAHRIARCLKPNKIIIASLYQKEVEEAIDVLEQEFSTIDFIGFWGDVFTRTEINNDYQQRQIIQDQLQENHEFRTMLFEDLYGDIDTAYQKSQLVNLILEHKPDVVVDAINTSTAISYQDIFSASKVARRDLDALLDNIEDANAPELRNRINTFAKSFEILLISQYIPQLIRHVLLINQAMREVKSRLYIKIGTTGTGGLGLNIPYTHGEDKPSAKLISKTAIGFAHTGLLFLAARTPLDNGHAPPVIKEIKPAALVGWVDISERAIYRNGKPAYILNSKLERIGENLILRVPESHFIKGEQLRMAVVDGGENGFFTKGEFEAVTALRQMEFMTPEEIARVVELEIRGSNTGKDVISAVDGSVMGPTYRAGYLRHQAIEELNRIEHETNNPSVALGVVGPPELSKLLWEAYLLRKLYKTIDAVLEYNPIDISTSLNNYLEDNLSIANIITSVGIPILKPDGKSYLRGSFISIPEVAGQNDVQIKPGDIDRWASKGWVDLRPMNLARWIDRFNLIQKVRKGFRGKGSDAVNKKTYPYEKIFIGEIVSWIFNNEMEGYRLK